jgi:hypothetical protein
MDDNENNIGVGSSPKQSQSVNADNKKDGGGGDFDSEPIGGSDDNDVDATDDSREEECVICFEKLSVQEWGRCTPCGHTFHKMCWWEWENAYNQRVNENRRQGHRARSEENCKCCLCNTVNKKFVDGNGDPAHNPSPYIAMDDPSDTGGNRFTHFLRDIGEEASGFMNFLRSEFRDHLGVGGPFTPTRNNRNINNSEQRGRSNGGSDNPSPNRRRASSFVPPLFGSWNSSYGTSSSGTAPPFLPPFFRNQSSHQQTSGSSPFNSNANPFNLLQPGTQVVTQNLVHSPHLNRQRGVVLQYQPRSARYLVRLESDISSFITGHLAPVAIRPENLLQTAKVKIQGLRTEPTLNGKEATICAYSRSTNRYIVKVDHLLSTREISIQPTNIRLPNGTVIRLEGLQQASQWNGKYGTIICFVEDTSGTAGSGRYEVGLSRQYGVRVKIENVRL